jgi:hypothetical protein
MSSIYLWRKVGWLVVCFVDHIEISQNHGSSCHALGNVFTYNGKVIEYWTNFSLKISFNSKQKIVVQFDVLLVFWKTLNEYVLMKVIWKNLDSPFHYYSRGYSYEKHPSCFIFGLKDATFVLFLTTVIVRFSYLLGLLLWRPVQLVSMLLASTRVLDKLRSTWR